MNFLAGFILLQSVRGQYDIGNGSAQLICCEESTFWLLASIFHRYELAGCFTAGLPTLQLCLAQWESLLQQYFPKLAAHMVWSLYFHLCLQSCFLYRVWFLFWFRAQRANDVHATMYATEWYLTLFSYRLPLSVVARIWDLFLVDGLVSLHRVGLALISIYEGVVFVVVFSLICFTDVALNQLG
jgi:hypothetical protein